MPVYSPLCDTDIRAYYLYLRASVSHGSVPFNVSAADGSCHLSGCDGSCDDDGSGLKCAANVLKSKSMAQTFALLGGSGGDDCFQSSHHISSGFEGADCRGVAGLAGDCTCSGGCGLCRGHSSVPVSTQIGCNDDAKDDERVALNHLGLPRGRNWARNVAARERRKQKKNRMRENWRGGSCGPMQGFFSSCDDITQKELRDSRAKLLIVQNKRKAAEEEKKIAIAGSVEGVVNELIRVTKLASDLKKQAGDSKIGGWAQTVADSLAKSVADSAPSTVPSLESVGYGKSALRSSNGEDFVDMGRVTDYENELKAVEEHYDALDGYSQDDYDLAIRRIKIKYSDVSQTPEEKKKKEFVNEIIDSLSATGLPMDKIEFAFNKIGVDVY